MNESLFYVENGSLQRLVNIIFRTFVYLDIEFILI